MPWFVAHGTDLGLLNLLNWTLPITSFLALWLAALLFGYSWWFNDEICERVVI
jgi:hypothetical protein